MTLLEIYENIPKVINDGTCDKYTAYMQQYDCRNAMYEWVAKEYEIETMREIIKHGMVNGVANPIYYNDTCAFYDKFSAEIWDLLYDQAQECGFNCLEFIKQLNGSDNVGSDAQFKNLLCWYAIEETCSMFINDMDGEK